MQKLAYILVVGLGILQACNSSKKIASTNSTSTKNNTTQTTKKQIEASKKGAWNEEDKKKFIESCESEIMALKDSPDGKTIVSVGVKLEDFAKKSCSCALKKVEQNYENAVELGKDNQGLTKIATECGGEAMKELMKK
jgi:hypothetical protein